MTKGEFPCFSESQSDNNNGNRSPGTVFPTELDNPTGLNSYENFKTDSKWTHSLGNKYHTEQKIRTVENEDDFNNNSGTSNDQINIAEYVENLSNDTVRHKIARLLSTDADDETLYDIENIDHYLLVARRTGSEKVLRCCENKLLSNLNCNNCEDYVKISEQYGLRDLKEAAEILIRNKDCSSKTKCTSMCERSTKYPQPNNLLVPTSANQRFRSYNALFTCSEYGSKRTVTTVVYDTEMRIKCYKDLKRGYRISNLLQCCCLQSDEDNPPSVIWSFGKSVYKYDPILNKCKKISSLVCKRSKFCMVAHTNRCFAIGGVYKSRKVLEIEEYDCCNKHSSWKIVASLPGDCLPINPSCVVFGDLVYIFCSVLTIEGDIKPNATSVHIFHPIKKTVKIFSEIPISFRQIKTCVHGSSIFMASDQKHFIRFSPLDGSYIVCTDQIQECKDFGMFTLENDIILAGGTNRNGSSNDVIRIFSTTSSLWTNHSEKLPDCMAIYGTCTVKVPNSAGFIVPFCEPNVFEKRY